MIQPSLLCGVAFVANMIIEISVCLANNAVKSAPKVFNHASEELSTELKSNGMTLNAKLRVRNILIQVQDFNM